MYLLIMHTCSTKASLLEIVVIYVIRSGKNVWIEADNIHDDT